MDIHCRYSSALIVFNTMFVEYNPEISSVKYLADGFSQKAADRERSSYTGAKYNNGLLIL